MAIRVSRLSRTSLMTVFIIIAALSFVAGILAASPGIFKAAEKPIAAPQIPQVQNLTELLSLEGFAKVNISVVKPVTLQFDWGCWRIQAQTTEPQIYSIELGFNNETGSRPTTHDLMKSIFKTLAIEVVQSKIIDFDPNVGTYIGLLILKQGETYLVRDSRPTDMIAIATRFGVPTYMKQSLLEKYGTDVCKEKGRSTTP